MTARSAGEDRLVRLSPPQTEDLLDPLAARPEKGSLVPSSPRPVALCWAVMLGFVRLATQRKVFQEPLSVSAACNEVRAWLAQPQVLILEPGRHHASIVFDFLERAGTAGNLTTDAHLAALAIEHQCELCSADSDFKESRACAGRTR